MNFIILKNYQETAERKASRRGRHFDKVEISGHIDRCEKLVPVVLIFVIKVPCNKQLINLYRSVFTVKYYLIFYRKNLSLSRLISSYYI